MRINFCCVFSILLLNSLGYVSSQTSVGDSVISPSHTTNFSERIQDVNLSYMVGTHFQQTAMVLSIFIKQPSISVVALVCIKQTKHFINKIYSLR